MKARNPQTALDEAMETIRRAGAVPPRPIVRPDPTPLPWRLSSLGRPKENGDGQPRRRHGPVGNLAALAGILLLTSLAGATAKPTPAHYEAGAEVQVAGMTVGSRGAVLTVENSGTPADGISVDIPPGALSRDATVRLLLNDGKIFLNSGESGGVFLRIAADGVSEFAQPVNITVRFDPRKWRRHALAGYEIDASGLLAVVDLGPKDYDRGTASFFTLVPLLFTWVYVSF